MMSLSLGGNGGGGGGGSGGGVVWRGNKGPIVGEDS